MVPEINANSNQEFRKSLLSVHDQEFRYYDRDVPGTYRNRFLISFKNNETLSILLIITRRLW